MVFVSVSSRGSFRAHGSRPVGNHSGDRRFLQHGLVLLHEIDFGLCTVPSPRHVRTRDVASSGCSNGSNANIALTAADTADIAPATAVIAAATTARGPTAATTSTNTATIITTAAAPAATATITAVATTATISATTIPATTATISATITAAAATAATAAASAATPPGQIIGIGNFPSNPTTTKTFTVVSIATVTSNVKNIEIGRAHV